MNAEQLQALLEERPEHREKPRCTDCAIHAARIGEERAANYQPALGTVFMIPATSGGKVPVCPYCSPITVNGQRTTLHEMGVTNRQALRRQIKHGLKANV